MSEEKTFHVVGDNRMHCGGCESTVKFALARLPGVEHVEADHRTQRIRVIFGQGLANPDQLLHELDWIGYQVEVDHDADS